MNILVCIKQVPDSNKVEVDQETGVLKRDGVESKMNPYDLYALETALRIREEVGGKIDVLTMGPPQAQQVIREAYMLGVDEGYLLSDRKFAGADVLATSYTLSQGIKSIGSYDLIICGKQTTDGDTAQVGPAIAEYLNIPHVTWVSEVREASSESMIVSQDLVDSTEVVEIKYPCLITVEKDINQPRLPSYRKKLETKDREIKILSMADLENQNEGFYGLNGSPTKVERIFPPDSNTNQTIISGEAEYLADRVIEILVNQKFIAGGEN